MTSYRSTYKSLEIAFEKEFSLDIITFIYEKWENESTSHKNAHIQDLLVNLGDEILSVASFKEYILFLCDRGAQIDGLQNSSGRTLFFNTIRANRNNVIDKNVIDKVKILLDLGSDPKIPCDNYSRGCISYLEATRDPSGILNVINNHLQNSQQRLLQAKYEAMEAKLNRLTSFLEKSNISIPGIPEEESLPHKKSRGPEQEFLME